MRRDYYLHKQVFNYYQDLVGIETKNLTGSINP